MKIYIAGPLCTQENRDFLEKIDKLCKELGFETFLPHRDAGLYDNQEEKIKSISEKDKQELHECDMIIGILDGITVGPGTAWEMGYMQALNKPVIGLKTDRPINQSIADISVIITGQTKIVGSLKKLREELERLRD